jgi:hypothetical protein
MRAMRAIQIEDFDRVGFHFTVSGMIGAPTHAVFAELADPSRWFPLMSSSLWHGRAACVGAEREVHVRLLGRFRERMLAWDPDTRVAFTMIMTTSPIVDRMAEDYRLTPELGGCRLDWTVAAEPTRIGRAARPAMRALLGRMFASARAALERRAASTQREHGTHGP